MSHKLAKIKSIPSSSAACGVRPRNRMSVAMAIIGEKYVIDAMRVAPHRRSKVIIKRNATADEKTPALKIESTNLVLNTAKVGAGSVPREIRNNTTAANTY